MAKLIVKDGKLCIVGGALVTDDGGAPCVCGGAPGLICYAQMTPCSCPSAGVVYYIPVYHLYRDGRIWPVYKIAGVCYQVLGTLATANPPAGWQGVPGFAGQATITNWYANCSAAACVNPSCPCPTGTELVTLNREACTPNQFGQVCTRYVLIQFNSHGQSIQTDILRRPGCPTIRPQTIKRVNASGWFLYDFVANTVVDAEFSVDGYGLKDKLQAGACNQIVGQAIYQRVRTYNENSVLPGPLGLPVWTRYINQTGITSNSLSVRLSRAGHEPVVEADLSDDEQFAFPTAVFVDGIFNECAAFSGAYNSGTGLTSQFSWGYTAGGFTSNASYELSTTNTTGNGSVSMSQSWAFYTTRPTTPPTEQLCGRFLEFNACDGSGTKRGVDTLLAGYSAIGNPVAVFTEDGQPRCYQKTIVNTEEGDAPDLLVPGCSDPACGGGIVAIAPPDDRPTYAIPDDFDMDEELRRTRAGGCCGQPSA